MGTWLFHCRGSAPAPPRRAGRSDRLDCVGIACAREWLGGAENAGRCVTRRWQPPPPSLLVMKGHVPCPRNPFNQHGGVCRHVQCGSVVLAFCPFGIRATGHPGPEWEVDVEDRRVDHQICSACVFCGGGQGVRGGADQPVLCRGEKAVQAFPTPPDALTAGPNGRRGGGRHRPKLATSRS